MAEGNTEGILVNEPKPAAAGSNTNPPVDMEQQALLSELRKAEETNRLHAELRKAEQINAKHNPNTQPVTSIPEFLNRSGNYIFYLNPEYGHNVLDKAGKASGIGIGADLLNARLYSNEGNTGIADNYKLSAVTHIGDLASFLAPSPAVFVTGPSRELIRINVEDKLLQQANRKSLKSKGKNSQKEDGIAVKGGKKKSRNNKECPTVGNPVNPVLGIKFLAGESELDFTLPSYFPLLWQRRYFSDIAEDGWLGQGWTLPFTQRLEKRDDGLYFINEQGTAIPLPRLSSGQTKFDICSQIYFSREANNRYRITFTGRKADLIFSPLTISGSDPQGQNASCYPLTGLEDPYGNYIRLIYNQAGLPEKLCTATGQWLALTFITLTQPGGETLQRLQRVSLCHSKTSQQTLIAYCYSADGDLSAVRDASGKTQREFEYKNHILVQHSVPGGVISRYHYNEYSPAGKVLSFYTNLGQTWSFEYSSGNTVVSDPLNRKTRYQFTPDNELTALTDAKGGITLYKRNKAGQLISIISPGNIKTNYSYDLSGNITSLTNAAGKKIYIHYDTRNNPVSVINETGKTTRYTYDNYNGLKSITNALNQTTEYIRDKHGLITGIKDPGGNLYTYVYNSAGQLTESRDCSGAVTRFTLNPMGNITKITGPDNAVTQISYARNGMISAISHPDGTGEQYLYNAQLQLIRQQNAAGEQTVFQRAPDGLPLSRTNPAGGVVSCEYDAARRLVRLKNESGACYTFTYDDNDNLIREQKFDNIVVLYQYDAANRLIKKYESGKNEKPGSGILTLYQRDKNGRLTEKKVSADNGTTQIRNYYRYDDAGLLLCAGNNESKNSYTYNDAGQCLTEISEFRGYKRILQYQYDNNGNCIKMTLPDNSSADYLYYGSGHLMQMNIGNRVLCEIERDIMHREISRTQSGLTGYFSYNKSGKIISYQSLPATEHHSNGHPVISRRYDYENRGYLSRILELSGVSTDYRYDTQGRLTRSGNEEFVYKSTPDFTDPAESRCDSVVSDGCLESCGEYHYRYDIYGNLTEKTADGKGTLKLHYTPEHRVAVIEKTSGNTRQKTYYGYDVFGRRIYKDHDGKLTIFLWDKNRLLSENSKDIDVVYLYPPRGYIPLARQEKKPGEESKLYYYHTDHLGTPGEITSADGKCVWQARFHAWGKEDTQYHGRKTGQVSQPLRYQGQYYDEESGLHYNRYRYYDPDSGRFITQDPAGLRGGLNPYQYAPNPVNWIDPLGLVKVYTGDIFRAIDPTQIPQVRNNLPLLPKPNPVTNNPVTNNTIQDHVLSTANGSRFMSATDEYSTAMRYNNTEGYGCVRISMDHIPDNQITDLRWGHPSLEPQQNQWAELDHEILIEGSVPPHAYELIPGTQRIDPANY